MKQDGPGRILGADLRRVIYALSDALDLVGVDDVAHGKRVGIMAAECARAGGFAADEAAFLFDLGLLHDIGVSSTETHGHLVTEFDWDGSQRHCETGYERVRDFAPLARMALPIRYHHTRWERLTRANIEPAVARQANLIFLVDRVDALAAPYHAGGDLLMHTQRIRELIHTHAASYFSRDLVNLFLAASASEAFWLKLEPRSVQSSLADMLAQGAPSAAGVPELKQLSRIFSRIVDAKSPFTFEHSLGVARLSRFLAERMGFGHDACDRLEIAGLLHDIGKLRIPDAILDKPASLDERERLVMNTHSFETFEILRRIPGFEDIALWAAHHHEEPGGAGYPFHLPAERLCIEARILRVADIFQAMGQDRPYRPGLPTEEVREFMEDMARKGRCDARIVAVATADMPEAMAAARQRPVPEELAQLEK
jgi:putative nucleotidyltransferase with HDIG domain